jgi:DNA-binding response OmpR family regulator
MSEPTVLIVDDDPAFGESVRKALEGYPVGVDIAYDAETAMEKLSARKYCGMLLDLVLPDANGFDLLRYAEQNKIVVPTVIVSEKLPAYVREMLHEEQVKLVFPKPVEWKLLGTVVLGLCGIPT